MTSVGEPAPLIDAYLRAVRAGLAGGLRFDEALQMVPAQVRDIVEARWLADRVVLEPVAVLSRQHGPRPWFAQWDPATGYHWPRLREYLVDRRGRSESVVEALDQSTDRILSMLEDPRAGGAPAFQVRGLVVGYVQSGKTANFSALIAKAVDAGYKIVIVLSGLHNSLRRQTQLRLEDELGLVASQPGRPTVGLADPGYEIVRMTGPETWGDFDPGTADASLLQGTVRLILVVKKNASVLRRLVHWLEDRPPLHTPVLVIDDEADQATINTGGNREAALPLSESVDLSDNDVDGGTGTPRADAEETNPSVINGLIRQLLHRMHRVAYVGYTATPFANVLIDRDALDRKVGADLYPADFIVSLPQPPGYVGTERLFGRAALAGETDDVAPLDVIRRVPDHEADLLSPGRQAPLIDDVPPSLQTALIDFLLALAARDIRAGGTPAAAMLIHGTPYAYQQLALAGKVREALGALRQRWRYDNTRIRPVLEQRWNDDFKRVTHDFAADRALEFSDIESAIARNFRFELPVLVMNTRTDDELDYEHHPDIRAIVVGGNKLSRGLTIEGLLVSYYVRPAQYFDTLLQMGRWFGYREDYVDITRLWTTNDLRERFRDLAAAEESLRREIRLYDVLQKTPYDFAPRIMAHSTMQVTAKNRMGSGREVNADFNGSLVQTINFELRRREWLADNLAATRRLLSSLGAPNAEGPVRQPTWEGIDWRNIVDFLSAYNTYAGASKVSSDLMREYIHAQATKARELTRWRVSVRARQRIDPVLGSEDLAITGSGPVGCLNRAREPESEMSIGTLVNPVSRGERGGDEEVGLDDAAIEAARTFAAEQDVSYALSLRRMRPKTEGLLLLYPISRFSRPLRSAGRPLFDDVERFGETVIGIAAVFPFSDSEATVRYIVGSAGSAGVS